MTDLRKTPPATPAVQSRATQSPALQRDSSSDSVVADCELADAPEKVWKALTVPELLAAWLPEGRDCEILASEPYRKLRYRWSAGERDRDENGRPLESVVTFELTGTATGGTHLRVIHQVFVDAVAQVDTSRLESPNISHRGDTVALAVTPMAFGVRPAARVGLGSGGLGVAPIGPRAEPAAFPGQLLLRRAA